ncbi:hypothetical protein GCM10010869_75960 [Mesorhizobium tianshanense]|nr:hypothetical protein GCM10010869_75960 [Mesorhizobium tianshanense]
MSVKAEIQRRDPTIGQTRFHWLRSAPDAPGASNLVGLTERIAFLRKLEIDMLHVAASINTRTVVPSTILLSASPKENQLAKALRELGRIERSLSMIEWYSSPALRRRCQAGRP